MPHYDYQDTFHQLYAKSVERYQSGNKDKSTWFSDEEQQFIADNGWRIQDFFDYGEDHVASNEPGEAIAQSIEQVRRDYFLHVQDGKPSDKTISADSLPSKSEAIEGIEWLPRIIEKAKGKIRGELCEEIMYCCGGDRRFLKTHDIHPAEFLRLVWANEDSPADIVAFVKSRSPAVPA